MGQGKYAKNPTIPSADEAALKNLTGGGTIGSIEKSEELENLLNKDFKNRNGQVYRTARLLGMLTRDNQIKATAPSKDYSAFSCEKYKFLLDAPFEISNQCCNVMKKHPSHDYIKKTGKAIITAQMASESRLRTQAWLKHGCNGFDLKNPTSNPMAFWTEQDVLLYIKLNNLPICSVYGEVVKDYDETENVDGQMDMSELDASFGIFDLGAPLLKTTGCKRTGCMFCGFGCHLEKEADSRFLRMKETHPKQYEWIMKPWEEGGLGFKDVIDWLNEHGNLNIRY